ncbi:hypothetical protein HMPREF9120_02718 [Neisseria sp. oral taxon 020 str. F0370]|nr:hypothetical protein HMPREF9120_02718 [Neisseria sp. oral taxon 020 str. F0370]
MAQRLPQAFFALGAQPGVLRAAGGGFVAFERAQHDGFAAFEHGHGGFGEAQGVVVLRVGFEVAQADALADDAAPFFVGQIGADAVGGEGVVAVVAYPLVGFAAQDVDDVAGGEALSGAVDAAEEFAHVFGGVEAHGRVQAVVAVAAWFNGFAEVAQEGGAAAGGGFAHGKHGVEFLQLDLFLEVVARAGLDALAQQGVVVEAIAQPALRGQAVASGAAAFLIEVFDALRHVEVGDEAYVGFVDAHAEGDGGDDGEAVFVGEAVLGGFALRHAHARVVGGGGDAVFVEEGGGVVDFFAAQAVDDAALPGRLLFDELQELFFAAVFFDDLVVDVRAVETGDEFAGVFEFEIVFDVGAGFGVGGGGEGDTGNIGEAFGQKAEAAVFGAEVVSPLADAVGFVDGEQADGCVVEKTQETLGNKAFGRHIKQFQTALGDVFGNLPHVVGRRAAVYRRAVHARRAQVGDLVVHQRNQRRHNNGDTLAHQRGNLVAQRFAAARGHQHQQALPARERVDDFGLAAAKGRIAEHTVQNLERARVGHKAFSVIMGALL